MVVFAQSLVISLLLTLALETLFSLFWGLRGRDLRLIALLNLVTNPAAVILHWLLCRTLALPELLIVPLLEGLVIWAEGDFCRVCGERIPHPRRFALLLNLFSFSAGWLLNLLFCLYYP